MLSKTTILLLGAGGFIGSHITTALSQLDDYSVIAVDKTVEKLKHLPNCLFDLTQLKLDITVGRNETEKLIREADVVVDLIAYANPSLYVSNPLGTVELNFFENLKIAKLCLQCNKFLVQFSSCEVYGLNFGRNEVFNEDTSKLINGPIGEHRWIYSCAKQLLERIIHAYGIQHGLNYLIVRPFNFVGPRIDYLIHERSEGNPRVFSHFMSALLLGKPLELVNGGLSLRSYTYIDDAVEAFKLLLLHRDKLNRQVINIGNPQNETSIKALASLMIELYEEETRTTFLHGTTVVSAKEFYGEGYADCDRRIPDASKLFGLGWRPCYNLKETFRRTIQYYLVHNSLGSSAQNESLGLLEALSVKDGN